MLLNRATHSPVKFQTEKIKEEIVPVYFTGKKNE